MTEWCRLRFDDFAEGRALLRGVPVRKVKTADGGIAIVTTAYDLLMAQYGVTRGLPGQYPKDYDDADAPYTPAWSEKFTGMGRDVLIRFAREWGNTANLTKGKCSVIIGAGINHWYHGNLMYRAGDPCADVLRLRRRQRRRAGALRTGQEKLAPMESWSSIAFARDWTPASRLQNAPSWHYVHSDQWRYEKQFTDYHTVPSDQGPDSLASGHTMDVQVRAVRSGWLPFYPQFNRNPLDVVREAEQTGAKTPEEVGDYATQKLKSGELKFAVEDPDAPENWPRVWFIWRGNALMASAKGHEYFLKHYLGTHTNAIATDIAKDAVKEVVWRDPAPQGKMDLVVDLNFRMDTSALYSDIVLPAATWYEKADLNSTDMHSFIHPLSKAVPPCWESKSDWQIFRRAGKGIFQVGRAVFSPRRSGTWWRRRWPTIRPRRLRSPTCAIGSAVKWKRSPARRCPDGSLSRAITPISTTNTFPSDRKSVRRGWARTGRITPARTYMTRP